MVRVFTILFVFCWLSLAATADDVPTAELPPPVAIDADDVKGKPEQELVKVTNARYFVWYDGGGWHLRTASKNLIKFTGSIKIEGGTLGRLRPIGLENRKNAKNPDQWGVNADRTEIRFDIKTGGSFDGFDFDVRRTADDARITYLLQIGRESRNYPKRIFLGRDSKNPDQTHFECPADPDRAAKE